MLCTDNDTVQTHKDTLVKEQQDVMKEWRRNPPLHPYAG